MYKHIKAIKHIKKKKKNRTRKSVEPKLEPLPQYKDFLKLDFEKGFERI